eukprot:PhM_4_TR4905/c0_g1_i1/m.40703/K00624/E2.3.1.7; carnitine O-acetyltransferase
MTSSNMRSSAVITSENENRSIYSPILPAYMKHQSRVPRFRVPSLEDTLAHLERYCKPILPSELERDAFTVHLGHFRTSPLGKRLQADLTEWSRRHVNWLEPLWYDSYLECRSPTPVNINYAFILRASPAGASPQPGHLPSAKEPQSQQPQQQPHQQVNVLWEIARVVAGTWAFKKALPNMSPDIERGHPLCMEQYQRLFGTCRIPKLKRDTLRLSPDTTHIIVLRNGHIYTVDLASATPTMEFTLRLSRTLEAILTHADSNGPGLGLGALTGVHRDTWATAFSKISGTVAIDVITSAQFAVALDGDRHGVATTQAELEELFASRCLAGLHGHGTPDRWYDTCMTLIGDVATGDTAMNMEHSWGDGHTVSRLCTFLSKYLPKTPPSCSGIEGFEFEEVMLAEPSQAVVSRDVANAKEALRGLSNSCHVKVVHFTDFGMGHIRNLKVSPDAFFQVAFQVAQYRTWGTLRSTYESVMIKNVRHGRTEAMRPVTPEMLAFVQDLHGSKRRVVPNFKAALSAHARRLDECKSGRGVQRHLLGLEQMNKRLIASGELTELHPLFSSEAVQALLTDTLSTSSVASPGIDAFVFGPVTPKGLGIGYTRTTWSMTVTVSAFDEQVEGLDAFVTILPRVFHELLGIANTMEATSPSTLAHGESKL